MKRFLKKALWNFKISITVFAIAAVLFFGSILWFNRIDWEPVNIPITTIDTPVTGSFTTKGTIPYVIDVEWDKDAYPNLPQTGEDLVDCRDHPEWMLVKWRIVSNGDILSEGAKCPVTGYISGAGDGTTLSVVRTSAGQIIDIVTSISGPADVIEKSHPRLLVRPSSMVQMNELMGWLVRRSIAVTIATAAAGFFILESLIVLIHYLFRRKKESSLVE